MELKKLSAFGGDFEGSRGAAENGAKDASIL
jgi:hypothetical protein